MAVVTLTRDAQRQIDALPRPIANRMGKLIERLRGWPRVSGAKALRGTLAGNYRLRTGDFRLQFRVEAHKETDDATGKEAIHYAITVEKAGHRDGFYE